MSLEFRAASAADVDSILKLMPIYYACDHLEFHVETARKAVGELVGNSNFGCIWLFFEKGATSPAGYAVVSYLFSLEYGGQVALVDELFVLDHYRGKGFGTQAIQHIVTQCKQQGLNAVRLEVTKTNTQALKLYQRLGFQDLGRSLLTYELVNE